MAHRGDAADHPDYPGQLAAAVFCQGYSWRCGYCPNPHLISATMNQRIDWVEVMRFPERRRGLLYAVLFSGGEPTLQRPTPFRRRLTRRRLML